MATQPLDELAKELVGTNTPFMSAALIIYDSLEIITRCPTDFGQSQQERDHLYDQIMDYPSDFIVILRLAEHFGASNRLSLGLEWLQLNFARTIKYESLLG